MDLYSASQFEKPSAPHSVVSASDGSQWYQVASGNGMGAFYQTPDLAGDTSEAAQVSAMFPSVSDGTSMRTVDDGLLEASHPEDGSSLWYNSAYYQEPDAPHDNVTDASGLGWYAMQPHAESPGFEPGDAAAEYNQAQFQQFMPGYGQAACQVDASRQEDGLLEVRHADGSGMAFYDKTMYQSPRGDHQVYEDKNGGQWYALPGNPTVERRPVYENGKPVYDGDVMRTVNTEGIKYKATLTKFETPAKRDVNDRKPPNPKRR